MAMRPRRPDPCGPRARFCSPDVDDRALERQRARVDAKLRAARERYAEECARRDEVVAELLADDDVEGALEHLDYLEWKGRELRRIEGLS